MKRKAQFQVLLHVKAKNENYMHQSEYNSLALDHVTKAQNTNSIPLEVAA